MTRTCPKCKSGLKKIEVKIFGAKTKAVTHQCSKCGYYEFEPQSSGEVLKELREHPLKLKQHIIKLSHDRLGMYINKDVARSLNLKGGEEIYVSVPDKNRLVIDLVN